MATLIAPARRPITPLTTSFELLRAMRPKQWLKNIFVFAALVFSQQHLWLQWRSVTVVAATFALFCVASSAIYLINDLVDIAHDRAHSIKCQRPIAAGRVRPATAMTAAIGMLLLAIVGAYVLNSLNGPI